MKKISLPIVFIIIIIIISLFSCENNNKKTETISTKLEKVYNEAGKNKTELEKVIKHYSNKPEDSLKLKAAYFLIENMFEHSYSKAKLVDTTKKEVSFNVLAYKDYNEMVRAWDSLEVKVGSIDFIRDTLIYDSRSITSDYLISNIDLAFKSWQKPWANHLSFDKFCEYVLPYRGSNEPIENWRQYFYDEFSWLEDSLNDKTDPIEVAKLINTNLKSWFRFDARLYRHPTDLGLQEMLKNKVGRCEDMTNLAIYAMRANGLPVMSDYVTHWPTTGNNHAWNSTYDKNGNVVIFMGAESNPGDYKLNNKKAKVYRKTYSIQDSSLSEIKPEYEKVPAWLSSSHSIDVTSEYIPVVNFKHEFSNENTDSINFAYLCVFNTGEWEATAWGKLNKEKNYASFKNVGTDILYLTAFYKKDSLHFIDYPYILDSLGNINFLKPIKEETTNYEFYSTTKRIIIKTTDEIRKADFQPDIEYELFYWDKKWISLGTQTTELNKPLSFNNMPRNALFWLKQTESKNEERVFTIDKQRKQKWW